MGQKVNPYGFRLGVTTDTLDATGTVVASRPVPVSSARTR